MIDFTEALANATIGLIASWAVTYWLLPLWGLHPTAMGKGYAVAGATAAIDWAFDVLGWTEVIHCIDPDNTPSQRVAERLGSSNQGPGQMPAPFQHLPIDIWGQSRAEWAARRAAR